VKLGQDEDEGVREAVSGNPNCPAATIQALIPTLSSKSSVAGNPGCPQELLDSLAREGDKKNWTAFVENPNCPAIVLSELALDDNKWVRLGVAENPHCPTSILETLASDGDIDVLRAVTKNPACPAMHLEVMAADDKSLQYVLENPACPSHVLEYGLKHESPWMLWLAVCHPNVTAEQLARVARNELLPPALRRACVQQPKFPGSEKALAEEVSRLANSPPKIPERITEDDWSLAFKALGLYPEDKKDVARAAKAKDWLQRAAATFSPDIQPNQLKLLLEDSEDIVRHLAADRLRQRESAKV
jgi:hypothetical protein